MNARMVSKKTCAATYHDFLSGLPMRAGMAYGAAWADEDVPCLAAALMAQRPPYVRPCEDALLEAERLYYRRLVVLLYEDLLGETAAQ